MPSSIVAAPAGASVSCQRAWKFISPATPLPDSFESPARHRFPAAARLRETGEFLAVRSAGRMVQGRYLRMTMLPRPGENSVRVGIVTSRRVGGAVHRNRVRRRLREIFRAHCDRLATGLWLVVVAKPGAADAGFADLRGEWLRLAGRLSILRDP